MSVISDKEFVYLQWINRFETATARQLMRRLHYKDTAYTTVTQRLKGMAERQLLVVDAKIQNSTKKISGPTKFYAIGPEGRKILEAEGIVVPRRNETRTADYFRHSMAVTNVLITMLLFAEDHNCTITNLLTEYEIQRLKLTAPILVTLASGETKRVEPDAIIGIERFGDFRTIIVEVEMGQEVQRAYSQKRWQEKLEKLVAFWEAEPERETISFVVIAMRGEEQAQTLRKWTEAFFQEQRKHYLSGHIIITHTFDPSQLLA